VLEGRLLCFKRAGAISILTYTPVCAAWLRDG